MNQLQVRNNCYMRVSLSSMASFSASLGEHKFDDFYLKNKRSFYLNMGNCKLPCGPITYLCLPELVWCHTIGCFKDVLLQFIMVAGEIFSWMPFPGEHGRELIFSVCFL